MILSEESGHKWDESVSGINHGRGCFKRKALQ